MIGEAIASVHAQTRAPLELIVVDDGSSDGSAELAERSGARVIRLARNSGNSTARNVGTRAASGDAIAWLDSDDYWEPHHLATVAGLLDTYPDAAAARASARLVGTRSGTVYGRVPEGPPTNVVREAFYDWLTLPTVTIVRRQALDAVGGFDEAERCAVDFDLWLRLACCKYSFVASREVTANWRWHDAQISSNPERQWHATYRFRKRALDKLRRRGEHTLAAELSEIFRNRWAEDLQAAWDQRRTEWLRQLLTLGSLVPEAPRALKWKWTFRSRLPAGALPILRACRSGVVSEFLRRLTP